MKKAKRPGKAVLADNPEPLLYFPGKCGCYVGYYCPSLCSCSNECRFRGHLDERGKSQGEFESKLTLIP